MVVLRSTVALCGRAPNLSHSTKCKNKAERKSENCKAWIAAGLFPYLSKTQGEYDPRLEYNGA